MKPTVGIKINPKNYAKLVNLANRVLANLPVTLITQHRFLH